MHGVTKSPDARARIGEAEDKPLGVGQSASAVATSPSRKLLVYLVRLMVCVGLLAYIFYRYDASSVLLRLQQVQFHWMAVAIALAYAGILIRSLRWKSILHSYGRKDSLLRLWRLWIEGGFFNLFFPGFVAGDVSRVARTSPHGKFSVESLMAVFLERFSGLVVASLFVGTVALLGGYEALGDGGRRAILLTILVGLSVLLLLLNVRWVPRIVRLLPAFLHQRVEKAAENIQYAVGAVISRPILLWQLTSLSLLFIFASVAVAYLVARSVNVPIPIYVLIAYVPLITLLVNLPISIRGIGVRENLFVFFYSTLGFLPEDLVAFALSQSALVLVVNLSGGVVLLLRSAESYREVKGHAR